jgi:hypothetical protein
MNNVSQMVALYYIVAFYECCAEKLKPYSPIAKFVCIKAVVFFSFWCNPPPPLPTFESLTPAGKPLRFSS